MQKTKSNWTADVTYETVQADKDSCVSSLNGWGVRCAASLLAEIN
jgi:hypothetical protein